jgi:hypothetical protein
MQMSTLVALLLSICTIIWGAATIANNGSSNTERIVLAEARIKASEDKIDILNQHYAEIEAKLDFMIQQRGSAK